MRIEILINDKLNAVFNFSNIPDNYYPSKTVYNDLLLTNDKSRISCVIKFKIQSLRKEIEIRLITNHSLRSDKKIFSDYFYNEDYLLTICIGDPDIIFFTSFIALFIIWFFYVVIAFLKKWSQEFIIIYKYLEKQFYHDFKDELSKKYYKLLKKLKNHVEIYFKMIFSD
ncbi:MAG: hypothetical protein EU529_04205 [Promethearchaeota archaeon]|nr:MAG: hypothetical protein EU529_04205 [Candidatus Lokiarchaeota archaeon]